MIFLLRSTPIGYQQQFVDQYLSQDPMAIVSDQFLIRWLYGVYKTPDQLTHQFYEFRNHIVEQRLIARTKFTVVNGHNMKYKYARHIIELSKAYATNIVMISIDPPETVEEMKALDADNIYPEQELDAHMKRYANSLESFYQEDVYNPRFKLIRLSPDFEVIHARRNG